jgi:hypothetical protein
MSSRERDEQVVVGHPCPGCGLEATGGSPPPLSDQARTHRHLVEIIRERNPMLKILFALVALAAVTGLALLSPGAASAAAVGHPELDAIASKYAGRPIEASCEQSNYDWDVSYELWGIYGVYYPSRPDYVFLSPAACDPLLVALQGGGVTGIKDAGLRPVALGLLVLLHESFHARGYLNEAQAEACAMRYLPQGLVDFGIGTTKTVAVKRVKYQAHRRKVGKRVLRWRTSRVVTSYRTVANRDHYRVLGWAQQWHADLPAEYQNGTC